MPRGERWRRLTGWLYSHRFGHGEGSAEARRLVDAKHQPTTQMRYLHAWEAFCDFCSRDGLRPLPAEPESGVCCLGVHLAGKKAQSATVAN